MAAYTVDGRLRALLVRGATVKADVADAVTKATLSLSASEVSQLELTVVDPGLRLLRSRLFDSGTPTKQGSAVDYANLKLEVRAIGVDPDETLTITARSLGAGKLKRARGALVRRNLSPTQFAGLEAAAARLKFVGEPSAKRTTITRQTGDDAESSWDTIQRLAGEIGYLAFESAGVLYFGRPTYLVKHTHRLALAWKGDRTGPELRALPSCRRTGDGDSSGATVDAELLGALGENARPGMALDLTGVPTFDGRYMVNSVTIELDAGSPIAVSASTPVNPTPQPATTTGGSSSSSTSSDGTKTAAEFVKFALAQAGDRYVLGAETKASDPDPDAFDCSELVQWAAARAGVKFPDGTSAQHAAAKAISVAQALKTRGALLFHPGHVAISLGDGRTIEAQGRKYGVRVASADGRFTSAGLIPGMRY